MNGQRTDVSKLEPIKTAIDYSYKKSESKVWILNFDDIPLPRNVEVKDRQVVRLAPGSVGGNHKHPRREFFIGIGEGLELVWLNESGDKKSEMMNPDSKLLMFEIPPNLPHAVVNKPGSENAVLVEFADEKMTDVEKVKVI